MSFSEALAIVLKKEGGYVNDPHDPGGMTNLGVTRRTWEEYTGRPASESTMRKLTQVAVAPLYRKLSTFWRFGKGWLARVDEIETACLKGIT
jgi:lysozyme family protein